ncbi:MAG: TonB-dependent receptor [Chitinophagaceae bacterium]|nr:TonB-dependent receptor [Chitinophagaceae bacterium]
MHPENSTLAFSQFAAAARNNWILEPQLEYNKTMGKSKWQILLGATFQNRNYSSTSIQASGYTTDLLLYSMNAAAAITASNNRETYRYNAVFARINYNLQRKYIVNLSARRDGSSRFGPGNRFANFAAAGLAWIFSEESFVKNNISFLSFGKLRASYGITGNDQIGDYRFLNLWSSTTNPYQSIPGLRPSSLFNPFLEWEKNKKQNWQSNWASSITG